MPHFSPSPHGRIKDLPDYSYDDVDYGTMLDLAKGRRFNAARSTSEWGYEPSYIPENTYKVQMGEAEKLGKSKEWLDALRKMVHTGGGKVRVTKEEGGEATITTQHAWGFNMGELKVPKSVLKKAGNILPMQIVQPWTDAAGNPVEPDKMQIQPLRRRRDYGEIEAEIAKRMKEASIASRIAATFLTEEEIALPKQTHQSLNTKDELYKQAEEADKQMGTWLTEISKKLALRHYHQVFWGNPKIDYTDEGAILITTPIKSLKRAEEKVNGEYGGDWSRLLDIVRATIGVDKIGDVAEVMDVLRKSGMKLARRPKDKFDKPDKYGFRIVLLNIVLPNGHIGELQINVKPILSVRENMHKYYEIAREIEAISEIDGKAFSKEDKEMIDEIIGFLKTRYNVAWVKAGGVL